MFKIFSVSVIVFFLFFSCKKDNTPSGAIENLTFSEDTIFFDTLFAELPNVTKVFKVYNSSNDDILIDKIFWLVETTVDLTSITLLLTWSILLLVKLKS